MKKLIIIFCLLMLFAPLWSQQIFQAEYFIGEDPGFGKGTAIVVTAGIKAEMSFNIPLGSLDFGMNTLYSRVKDSDGSWSQTLYRVFLKQGLSIDTDLSITKMEYFFDEDPGVGLASPIEFQAGEEISVAVNLPLETLTSGIHSLYIRTKDNKGSWSIISNQAFFVQMITQEIHQVSRMEYFFDEDPGVGLAALIEFQAGEDISVAVDLPLETLTSGIHTLYIRTKDDKGSWSIISNQAFLVQTITQDMHQVTRMEYFFDEDPGVGLATPIELQSGEETSVSVNLPLENLSDGMHILYVRTRNDKGSWGIVSNQVFMKLFTSMNTARVTRMEYFVNTDPGVGNGTRIDLNTPKQTVMKYFVINPENLQVGTNTLYVRTLDNLGSWGIAYYTNFEVLQTEACNPPSDLSATDVTETTASLQWTGQGTSWDLLWVPDAYDYTENAELYTGSANPQSIDNLTEATLYDFYVRTICSDGQVSPWAGSGIFHTLPLSTNQLSLFAEPEEGGILTGEGTYAYGETVSISAIPNTNFTFHYWSGDTSLLDDAEAASTTFTMPAEPVTLTAHFMDVTGIPDIPGLDLKLFPNPSRDEFWVEFNNLNSSEGIIKLLNMQGQIVAQKIIEANDEVRINFNTSSLSPGVYMLYIQCENWQVMKKVIVNP